MNLKESFPKVRKINIEYFDCLSIDEINQLNEDKNTNLAILTNEIKKIDFNKDYILKLINQLQNGLKEFDLIKNKINDKLDNLSGKLCVFLKDKNIINNSDLKNLNILEKNNGIFLFVNQIKNEFIINKDEKTISLNFTRINNFKKENIKLIKLDLLKENNINSDDFDENSINKSLIIEI